MREIGKYIYGVINSTQNLLITIPDELSIGEKNTSNNGYAIPHQDVSAVVSDSEIVDYTNMRRDILAKLLVRHQKVIEKVMAMGYAIIPMKLGTIVIDENEAKDILNRGYRLIKDIIKKINDKIEIDVVSTWNDFPSVLKEIGEEGEIKEFKQSLLSISKGVTAEDQLKVGMMVKKALEKKREKHTSKIENTLKTVSQGSKPHELMDEKMVSNSAFLINKDRQKDFDRKVEELNAEFKEKLNFKCVGPLPPYSFYTLEIKKMEFEEIDWARKRLGLKEAAAENEIKTAYRTNASFTHPDTHPDKPGIEKEFEDVNKAYKMLMDYSQACEQAGQKGSFSFDEEEVEKKAILIKVRE